MAQFVCQLARVLSVGCCLVPKAKPIPQGCEMQMRDATSTLFTTARVLQPSASGCTYHVFRILMLLPLYNCRNLQNKAHFVSYQRSKMNTYFTVSFKVVNFWFLFSFLVVLFFMNVRKYFQFMYSMVRVAYSGNPLPSMWKVPS